MNFGENSWILAKFYVFFSAGSAGSVWNLDPGSHIRIRKSATRKNMEIWKFENLEVLKSENLETWKFENLETGTRTSATRTPLGGRHEPEALKSAAPKGLARRVKFPLTEAEEIFRLDLRLMPPI